MATTVTTEYFHTGDGSTRDYSVSFPYLKEADVKVTLDHVLTTAYTFQNASTLRFTTAPAIGVAIRIYRDTDVDAARYVLAAGSAVMSGELNENYDQLLYADQRWSAKRFDQSVSTAKLRDGAVTAAKFAAGSITSARLLTAPLLMLTSCFAAIAGSKLAAATTSAAGSMSAADKTKLDGIEASATADQTGAEIKTAYEAESNTHAFTDAEKQACR